MDDLGDPDWWQSTYIDEMDIDDSPSTTDDEMKT
jgi:hypothetical protein